MKSWAVYQLFDGRWWRVSHALTLDNARAACKVMRPLCVTELCINGIN